MKNFKLVVVMVVAVVVIGLAQAQEKSDCAKTTQPCMKYIGSMTDEPQSDCCGPLKVAVKSSLVCVCSIYGDTKFLELMGFDPNATLSLPQRCGIAIDLVTDCKAALTPAAPSPASTTQSPSNQPAASPTGAASPSAPTTTVTTTPGPSAGKSAASNMAWSAVTVMGSFFMWATMML